MSFSVKAKVIGLAVGVSLTTLLAACAVFVWYDRESFAESKQSTLEVLGASLAGSASGPTAFQDATSSEYVLRTVEAEATAHWAAIYLQDGTLLASWSRGDGWEAPADGGHIAGGYAGSALHIRSAIESEGTELGTLVLEFGTDDIDARTRLFLTIAAAILALSIVLGGAVALRLQRTITGPVLELERAAARVRAEQDFAVRAKRMSNDELGELTDVFNGMLEGIQAREAELELHRTGLEKLVAERTHELDQRNASMRLVLDNVEQGFLTIDMQGELASERSAIVDRWFEGAPSGGSIAAFFDALSPGLGDSFLLAWEQVTDGFLPVSLTFEQLPRRFQRGDQSFELDYKPLYDGGELSGALVIASDVTARVQRELREREQREFVLAVERALDDRAGFQDFIDEMSRLVLEVQDPAIPHLARALHTIKGNAALFGRQAMAELCHALEDELAENGTIEAERLATLRADWEKFVARIAMLVGSRARTVEVPSADLERIADALDGGTPSREVLSELRAWLRDPTAPKLRQLANDATGLAGRLGRAKPEITIDDQHVRVARDAWAPLWASLVHVVRNSLDHGIEVPEDRRAAGKPEAGHLTLSTSMIDDQTVELVIADDGRGIDWERVRAKAKSMGLKAATQIDLEEALFSDGLSTRDAASATSGRGVGMGAFREAVVALGGSLSIRSELGKGTAFRALVPVHGLFPAQAAANQSPPSRRVLQH